MITLPKETKESLGLTVTTDADPTATVPEFAFPACGDDPATWYNGQWNADGWNSTTEAIDAETPLVSGVGVGGQVELTAATVYDVWARFTVGAEIVARRLDRLMVR